MANFRLRFTAPGMAPVTSGIISITAPPAFGDFEELAALFTPSEIYKYAVENAAINPMDEAVPQSNGSVRTSYGWYAQAGDRSPGVPFRAPTVVTDPVRGQVLDWKYLAGDAGGGAPIRIQPGVDLTSLYGPVINVTAQSRGDIIGEGQNYAGRIVTVTAPAHGLTVGEAVQFAGATVSGYNGPSIVATVPDANTFTYIVPGFELTTTPTASGTMTCRRFTAPTEIGYGFYAWISPNWTDNGNVGTKLVFTRSPFPNAGRDRLQIIPSQIGSQNHLLSLTKGDTFPDQFAPYFARQQPFGNHGGTHGFPRNQWHKVQVYQRSNTAGNSDGKLRIWVTPLGGAKELWYTSDTVLWHESWQFHGWAQMYWDPTYGGGVNPVPADQSFRTDDLLIASKTATPVANAITLQPLRLASGSASTLMSSGIGFRIGQVMPAALSSCGLWRNGVEVACNLTALEGRYHDGSLVAALLQYQTPETLTKDDNATGASPNAASYELRLTGSSVARTSQQASWIKDVPDGVWRLPPTHYKEPVAALWSPLTPLSEVPAGSRWKQIDTLYETAANRQWEVLGNTTNGTGSNTASFEGPSSKYDQPRQRVQFWARGGACKFLERGLLQNAVSRNYMQGGQQWHNQNDLGLAMGYWLTGVTSFRTVAMGGTQYLDGYDGPGYNPAQDEGRITGRNIGWALMYWMLGGTSSISGADSVARTPLQTVDDWGFAANPLHQQQTASPSPTNGGGVSGVGFRPEWLRDTNSAWMPYGGVGAGPTQSNFMTAMRAFYADLYRVYRGPAAGNVQPYLELAATFMRTQFNAGTKSYHYWSEWTAGDAQVSLVNMREISMLTATVPLAARAGNPAIAIDQVQDVLDATIQFAEANTGVPGSNIKQFTEDHYTYMYMMARSGTVGVL